MELRISSGIKVAISMVDDERCKGSWMTEHHGRDEEVLENSCMRLLHIVVRD